MKLDGRTWLPFVVGPLMIIFLGLISLIIMWVWGRWLW
jgi:hypothetical protein